MRISRFALLTSFVFASSIAFGQTLPPPAFAGQSYWFGPGPSALTVNSSTQDTGGYAEMSYSLAGWSIGATGGPAFVSASPIPINQVNAVFNVPTSLTIQPYIYIDGYFGVTASVTGFGSVSSTSMGTSRFYVIHNIGVQIVAAQFSRLTLNGNNLPPFIPTTYNFSLTSYNGGSYTESHAIVAPQSSGGHTFTLDPTLDNGISQVDIERVVSPSGTELAGTYQGMGIIQVTSL